LCESFSLRSRKVKENGILLGVLRKWKI
jgi:hypothetical protein